MIWLLAIFAILFLAYLNWAYWTTPMTKAELEEEREDLQTW